MGSPFVEQSTAAVPPPPPAPPPPGGVQRPQLTSQYEANQAAVHSVVSVAQLSQVAPGHLGSGGGSTSIHGLAAVPPAPPLGTPPPDMPPLVVPPFGTPPPLLLEPPTVLVPEVPVADPALPFIAPPPPLSVPAMLPNPDVVPALETVPGGAAAELSGEQPPLASNVAHPSEADAQTMERRKTEPKARGLFCIVDKGLQGGTERDGLLRRPSTAPSPGLRQGNKRVDPRRY